MVAAQIDHLPFPANEILKYYFEGLRLAKNNCLKGFYLTGSLALNDFHAHKSDIDFIALINDDTRDKDIEDLRHLHGRINSLFQPHFNGYYLTEAQLNAASPSLQCPASFKKNFYSTRFFELDKITLYEIKRSSMTILGKDAATLGINITLDTVLEQLNDNINSYWTTWVRTHTIPRPKGILLMMFPVLTEWGVLGVARQLHTLKTGEIASKTHAGNTVADVLPEKYIRVVKKAVTIRKEKKIAFALSFTRYRDTLASMKFMINEYNRLYKQSAGVAANAMVNI